MARAVPARRAEFAAGRGMARQALRSLGLLPVAIAMGPDRTPVWPDGVVGSIAHTARHAAALVARAGPVIAVGLDLEPDLALDPDLWPEICTTAELAQVANLPQDQRGLTVRLLFSAKECCYKCLYPLGRQVLGFHDIQVVLDPSGGTFAATLGRSVGPWAIGTTFAGRMSRSGGLIQTVMILRQPG